MRAAAAGAVLKVIVESAVLLGQSNAHTLVDACRAAEDAGADFVKTSTGCHPAGGATVRAVELMAETVGPRLGSKPAVGSAPPPTRSRCSTPVPPGWACPAPGRCSMGSADS